MKAALTGVGKLVVILVGLDDDESDKVINDNITKRTDILWNKNK